MNVRSTLWVQLALVWAPEGHLLLYGQGSTRGWVTVYVCVFARTRPWVERVGYNRGLSQTAVIQIKSRVEEKGQLF